MVRGTTSGDPLRLSDARNSLFLRFHIAARLSTHCHHDLLTVRSYQLRFQFCSGSGFMGGNREERFCMEVMSESEIRHLVAVRAKQRSNWTIAMLCIFAVLQLA